MAEGESSVVTYTVRLLTADRNPADGLHRDGALQRHRSNARFGAEKSRIIFSQTGRPAALMGTGSERAGVSFLDQIPKIKRGFEQNNRAHKVFGNRHWRATSALMVVRA